MSDDEHDIDCSDESDEATVAANTLALGIDDIKQQVKQGNHQKALPMALCTLLELKKYLPAPTKSEF